MSSPGRRSRSSAARRSIPEQVSSPVRYDGLQSSSSQPPPVNTPRSGTSHVPQTPTSHLSRTPDRAVQPPRGEIAGRAPVVAMALTSDEKLGSETDDRGEESLVWGTSVNVNKTMEAFRKFFSEFLDPASGEPLYPRLLHEIVEADTYNINVDCRNLYQFDRTLYNHLVSYPTELIPIFDLVLHYILQDQYPTVERRFRTQVRTFNLVDIRNMRELDPVDIDKMVAIKGMVIRVSAILPDLRASFFKCSMCEHTITVPVDRGRITEPQVCPNCKQNRTMVVVHNRSTFADRQMIKLQETPDSIPEGETPHTVTIFAFDDLVDVAKPGDRVVVTGIFKARPMRANPRRRSVRSVFSTYIDVIHFQKTSKGRVGSEDANVAKDSEFYTGFEESNTLNAETEAMQRELHELAADPNIYQRLVRSLAPSIWEMDDVKRGILALLFGGTNKTLGAAESRFRGELNILLCGDPGTSKSQLLSYVHKIAPRGIYTSGKGSSAVGLTAYISKDPDSGEMVLESGALVLSDRGVCCIDEFDKMNDSTRSILHEVMEQQTVSIAKAGIVATLNARTSVLASANPVGSRYDPRRSVVDNIDLPPTLLSRFDLIYLILDQPDETHDRRLAQHLVSLYYKDDDRKAVEADAGIIPTEMLTRYISYARSRINPVISQDSVDELINGYVEMRKLGSQSQRKVVTATPRQLESLIRISEALAKMRFSDMVEKKDVVEARRLMSVATQTAATDPTTGLIDMDLINTGRSSGERRRLEQQLAAIKELLEGQSHRKSLRISQLVQQFNESSDVEMSNMQIRALLELLADENYLVFTGKSKNAVQRV